MGSERLHGVVLSRDNLSHPNRDSMTVYCLTGSHASPMHLDPYMVFLQLSGRSTIDPSRLLKFAQASARQGRNGRESAVYKLGK